MVNNNIKYKMRKYLVDFIGDFFMNNIENRIKLFINAYKTTCCTMAINNLTDNNLKLKIYCLTIQKYNKS